MNAISRRNFIKVAGTVVSTPAMAFPGSVYRPASSDLEDGISVADPRYADLRRGANGHWIGTPDQIYLPSDGTAVMRAVQRAVDQAARLSVRSGGHCYEDFSTGRDVKNLIDMRHLDAVTYDVAHKAFSVGAGASLGRMYAQLYSRWGVTLPGGTCPGVGVGGHVSAGGYGALSRKFGLIVDYLYGVEIVVVDARGNARMEVVTKPIKVRATISGGRTRAAAPGNSAWLRVIYSGRSRRRVTTRCPGNSRNRRQTSLSARLNGLGIVWIA
jgi:FAD/FMN-containing dehydrogenase